MKKDFVLFPDWLRAAFRKVYRDRVTAIAVIIFAGIALYEVFAAGNFLPLFMLIVYFFLLLRAGVEKPAIKKEGED